MRVAVRVCATVSAIPPSTLHLHQLCVVGSVSVGLITYGVRDHGGEEWSGGIVGVELAYQYGDHSELD